MTIVDHAAARAALGDHSITAAEYLAVCREHGWEPGEIPISPQAAVAEFLDHADWALSGAVLLPFPRDIGRRVVAWLHGRNLKGPDRQEVVHAARRLHMLSHRAFDDMLSAFGVATLSERCDRNAGGQPRGMQARVTALTQFAMQTPAAITAEGRSLHTAIIAYAAAHCGGGNDVG